MKEGDSIGVVLRHEMSPVDELGRYHSDQWVFCKVLLSCNSAYRFIGITSKKSLEDLKEKVTGEKTAPQNERGF